MVDPLASEVGQARDAAVERLREAWSQGRIDVSEHERRTTGLRHASTVEEVEAIERGDLRSLGEGVHTGGGLSPVPPLETPRPREEHGAGVERSEERTSGLVSLPTRAAGAVLGLTPFVSVILFFTVGGMGLFPAWLWFLLIPIVGILVHGPRGGDPD
ncbi:MAG: DUF1707 domain-containing protein [Mobilicoccus sp.]|nr:DUF1707 domain-containing protein [Mobilicoccus sp.]